MNQVLDICYNFLNLMDGGQRLMVERIEQRPGVRNKPRISQISRQLDKNL